MQNCVISKYCAFGKCRVGVVKSNCSTQRFFSFSSSRTLLLQQTRNFRSSNISVRNSITSSYLRAAPQKYGGQKTSTEHKNQFINLERPNTPEAHHQRHQNHHDEVRTVHYKGGWPKWTGEDETEIDDEDKSDRGTYNALLKSCTTAQKAKEVFESMSALMVPKNDKTFVYLLRKLNDINEAQPYIQEINELGLKSSPIYNSLILLSSSLPEAMIFYNEMLQHQLIPNRFTFNALISTCKTKDEINTLLDQMTHHEITPNIFTLNAIFNSLVRPSSSSSSSSYLYSYSEIIDYYNLHINRRFPELELELSTYHILIKRFVNDQRALNDIQLRLSKSGLSSPSIYNAQLAALCDNLPPPPKRTSDQSSSSSSDTSPSVFDKVNEMLKEMMTMDQIYPDIVTFNIIFNMCRKQNDYKRAMWYFEKMTKLQIRPTLETFNSLISTAPNPFEADKLFRELIKTPSSIASSSDPLSSTQDILPGSGNDGVTSDSSSSSSSATSNTIRPNLFTLNSLLWCCGKKLAGKKAFDYINEFYKTYHIKPDVYSFTILFRIYARNDDVKGIEQAWSLMNNLRVPPTRTVCSYIIEVYQRKQNSEKVAHFTDLLNRLSK